MKIDNKTENLIQNLGYNVKKFIGKGKSGYSYLAEKEDGLYVFKYMHDEHCPYYNFQDSKVSIELNAYNFLMKTGIKIPKLISYSIEQEYILKEYIDGDVAISAVAENKIKETHLEQIFSYSNLAKSNNINIDYFPANFVINKDSELFYIDYEINNYSEEWNLVNWGIYYWLNTAGMAEFLKTGNPLSININAYSGIPIKEPFEVKVKELISKVL